MSVYLIVFIFLLSMGSVRLDFTDRVSEKNKIRWFNFICIFLILTAAMKTEQTTFDTNNYIQYFKTIPGLREISSHQILNALYEPGMILIGSIVKTFHLSYHVMFAVLASLAIVLYRSVILQYARYRFLSLFVYVSCYFFLNEICIIRHGTACALVFYNIRNIVNKKIVRSVITLLAASVFHAAGCIGFLPLIICWSGKGRKRYTKIFLLTAVLLSCIVSVIGPVRLAESVAVIIPSLQGRVLKMTSSYAGSTPAGLRRLILYAPFLWLSLRGIDRIKALGNTEHTNLRIRLTVYNYIISGYFCIIAFSSMTVLSRFNSMLLASVILSASLNLEDQNIKINRFACLIVFLLLCTYIFMRHVFFNAGNSINLIF